MLTALLQVLNARRVDALWMVCEDCGYVGTKRHKFVMFQGEKLLCRDARKCQRRMEARNV